MARGLLYHLCVSEAESLRWLTQAVVEWHGDRDYLNLATDLQEWIRRCGRVRDEVTALYQRTVRLALTGAEGFAATAPAFLNVVEGALRLMAVVQDCLGTARQLGHPIGNEDELDRAILETTAVGEKFLARFPAQAGHGVQAWLTRFHRDKLAVPTGDTVAELALPEPAAARTPTPEPLPNPAVSPGDNRLNVGRSSPSTIIRFAKGRK